MKRLTVEEFESKAREIHNEKYIYHQDFNGTKKPITMTCPKHGDFTQTPKKHLEGQGCPQCAKERLTEQKQGNFSLFLTKFKDKFGFNDIFPYISSEYVSNKSYITVQCPKCGATVKRTPNYLLTFGYCCHKCSNIKAISYKDLVERSKCPNIEPFDGEIPIKGGKVTLICEKHGKYQGRISSILKGRWKCKLCSMEKANSKHKLSFEDVEKRVVERFNGQISLVQETFKDTMTPMRMKCNVCGNSFERSPNCAIFAPLKHACPHCGALKVKEKRTKTLEDFINKAEKVHGKGKYDFSETKYVRSSEKVRIKCNDCGRVFEIEANSFLNGHGCPYHNCNSSLMEKEIADYINSLGVKVETNDRKLLGGMEIDIYLPTEKIAFEFNGIFWHDERNKPKDYHQGKSIKCIENGVRLVHIFENEWIKEKEQWKWFIKCVLRAFPEPLSAFDCKSGQLSHYEGESFLEANSVTPFKDAENYVSYMLNNEIVGVVGYTERKLLAYGLKMGTEIDKLLTRFLKEHDIDSCELPFSIGIENELIDNGFVLDSITQPNRFETFTRQNATYYSYDCGEVKLIRKI